MNCLTSVPLGAQLFLWRVRYFGTSTANYRRGNGGSQSLYEFKNVIYVIRVTAEQPA